MSSDNTIDTGVVTARLRALSTDTSLEILVVDDDELARIHSAFTTYSLRRELRETRDQLAAAIARK
jgi:hypothetical protein